MSIQADRQVLRSTAFRVKQFNHSTSGKGELTCTPLTASQVNEADLAYLLPRLTAIFQLPQAELQSGRQALGMLAVTWQLEVQESVQA